MRWPRPLLHRCHKPVVSQCAFCVQTLSRMFILYWKAVRIRSHDARGCVRVNYFINCDYALLNPKPHKALNPESFTGRTFETLHPPTLSPKALQPGEDISVKQLERHSVEVRPTSCLDSSGPRRLIPGYCSIVS